MRESPPGSGRYCKPEYLAVVPHRSAALADSRLIATRPLTNLLNGD